MPPKKSLQLSKLIALEAFFLVLIPLFFVLVWTPVYHAVSSDILMSESLFLLLWDLLKEVLTYFFYWFSIVFLAISLLSFGWKISFVCSGFYLLGSLVRSVGTALSSAVILHSFGENLIENLKGAVLDTVFDALLWAAFYLVFFLVAVRGLAPEMRKSLLPPAKKGFLPIPLHLSVLICVVLHYLVRLFGRIRYDIFYGAPSSGQDLGWMIFYYVADLVFGFVGYFAVIAFLRLFTKEK